MRKHPKFPQKAATKTAKAVQDTKAGKGSLSASDRRQFLKNAGMIMAGVATAGTMMPKPLKAMAATNARWLEAVALSSTDDCDCNMSCSLDTSDWETQDSDCWCWAATSVNMFYYYYLSDVSQCDIATDQASADCTGFASGYDCCAETNPFLDDNTDATWVAFNNNCNNYFSFGDYWGGSCDSRGKALFSDIAAYICDTGPVVAYVGVMGGGSGPGGVNYINCHWTGGCETHPAGNLSWAHYLTICGFADAFEPDQKMLYVFDPDDNDGTGSVYYDDFPDYGSADWWSTIYT